MRPRRDVGGAHVRGIRDRRDAWTPRRRRVVRTDRRRWLQRAVLVLDRTGCLAANHVVVHSHQGGRERRGVSRASRPPAATTCPERGGARSADLCSAERRSPPPVTKRPGPLASQPARTRCCSCAQPTARTEPALDRPCAILGTCAGRPRRGPHERRVQTNGPPRRAASGGRRRSGCARSTGADTRSCAERAVP